MSSISQECRDGSCQQERGSRVEHYTNRVHPPGKKSAIAKLFFYYMFTCSLKKILRIALSEKERR